FNFLALRVVGFGVADTVAKTADTMSLNRKGILFGVIVAFFWNLLTWWLGIPSSSLHTLFGSFAVAAVAHAGLDVVNWYSEGKAGELPHGVLIIIAFIVLAPFLGAIVSYAISIWLLHSARKSIWPKVFTICLMIATIALVNSQLISYEHIHKP